MEQYYVHSRNAAPRIVHQTRSKIGDILLEKNGTTGVAAIVHREEVFDIYVSLALIRVVRISVDPTYVLRAIGSSYIQDYFNGSLKGIGVPNLHLEHIRKALIPIPPYAEQDRIIFESRYVTSVSPNKLPLMKRNFITWFQRQNPKSSTLLFVVSLYHKIQMMNLLLFCWSVSEQRKKNFINEQDQA